MSNKFSGELVIEKNNKISILAWRRDATGRRIGRELVEGDECTVLITGEHVSGTLDFIPWPLPDGPRQWILTCEIPMHSAMSASAEFDPPTAKASVDDKGKLF